MKDDQAVVELHSLAIARNGFRFDDRYCWVVHFNDKVIDWGPCLFGFGHGRSSFQGKPRCQKPNERKRLETLQLIPILGAEQGRRDADQRRSTGTCLRHH